jgi:4-amino-4-deoxy-L-arabinose transferase-like glycosyltransferase
MFRKLSDSLPLTIMLLISVLWFVMLGQRDLIDPDEGRYAEISREMVVSGDWTTPRMNDLKYFEKPALQYWMTAISFKIFGFSNTAARLWVALISLLGAIFIAYVTRRLYGHQAGYYAFLTLMSGLMYFLMGHLIALDMSVSVFLAIGIGALVMAQTQRSEPHKLRNWMLLGWVALALAVLSKGLIGIVLPGIAMVGYTLWQRDWKLWTNLHLGKGLLVFLLITAPWFIKVSMENPEFAHFFFIHEHFERFTTDQHGRTEPVWYFLPLLIVGAAPWFGTALQALVKPEFSWLKPTPQVFNAERFMWVYIVGLFLFFSAGSSKLPPYILPMFPILAILMGKKLAEKNSLWIEKTTLGLTLGVILFGVYEVTQFTEYESASSLLAYRNWIIAAAITMAIAFLLVLVVRNKFIVISTMAVLSLLSFQLLLWGFDTQSRHRSAQEMATTIKQYLNDDLSIPIYSVEAFNHSLTYYLQRPVTLVIYSGELEMGIKQQPEKWLPNWKAFSQRWQAADQAIAIFDMKSYPHNYQSRMEQLPMKIIYQDTLKIAVAKK